MRVFLLLLPLWLGACATSPGGAMPLRSEGTEREVAAVAEALFSAMRTRDTTAIRTLFLPGVQIVALRAENTSSSGIQRRSVSDFITSIARPGDELRERMWNADVEVTGDLATLWAPYDFHIGERFSHCGFDAFHFVRQGGAWRIAALTYTVQAMGCEALR